MANWFDPENFNYSKPNTKKLDYGRLWWIAAIAIVVISALYGLKLYMDVIQLKEIGTGYTEVFWTNFSVKLLLQVVSFLVIFVCILANNLVLRKVMLKDNYDLDIFTKKLPIIILSFIIALLASNIASITTYDKLLKFVNASWFNIKDPVFYNEIGYYVFQRPFYMALVSGLKGLFMFIIVYTAIIYVVLLVRDGIQSVKEIIKKKGVIVHNVVNILLYFALSAFTYKFAREELLLGKFGGGLTGAGFVDASLILNFYRIAPYLLLAIVVVTIILLLRGKIKQTLIAVAIFPTALILVNIVSGFVQGVYVVPNEVVLENQYIQNNINMTRKAYGLDNVIENNYEVNNNLTKNEIEKNKDVIDNIRIVDFKANLTATSKLQELGTYYSFTNTNIVPYTINGKKTAISIGAREIDKKKVAQKTNTYINKTFKYTHGFGAVASSLNRVSPEGQPYFFIDGIPPVSKDGIPKLLQPRIYYGELTNDQAVVNTDIKEIDYVKGATSYEYNYTGDGGLPLNFTNKLLFAMKYGDYNLLLSGQLNQNSRILPNRNILERVKMVAPFFEYDPSAYLVVTDKGELKWVIDAYTKSSDFPYAERLADGTNYIKNSVKAVVDAYNGKVTFYIYDKSDPIAQTYKKIYPTLFSQNDMPVEIASHITYPERLFALQAEMYKRYHTTDAQVFYGKNDLWDFAKQRYDKKDVEYIEPYYNMANVKEFNEDDISMIVMMPYTQQNNDYINAWFAVGSDNDSYGKMVVYRFKETGEKKAYGTLQIENRIDNDPKISSQISLWNQSGSNVIRGNMIVVPIENSVLYVEPLYITTQNSASFPELKRVIVAYGDQIVMEPTLEDAIKVLFENKTPTQVVTPSTNGQQTQNATQSPSPNAGVSPSPNVNQAVDKTQLEGLIASGVQKYNQYKEYNATNNYESAGKSLAEFDAIMQKIQGITGSR